MKLVGMMPARNSDWVLGLSARALLMWVDALVILDHASIDATPDVVRELALEYPGRVRIIREENPVWEEMAHRQRLLDVARELGATHIITVDDDEVLSGRLLPCIRRAVESCPADETLQLSWLCLRGGITRAHADGIWGNARACVAFVDAPHLHWSSTERGGYDFHHRHPMGRPFRSYFPIAREFGGLMHLQFMDDRRLRAKQALYKMQEVVRWPSREPREQVDARYNPAVYGSLDGQSIFDSLPAADWKPYLDSGWMRHLRASLPWQEAECERLWNIHGAAHFAGLDLFGVPGRFKAPAVPARA